MKKTLFSLVAVLLFCACLTSQLSAQSSKSSTSDAKQSDQTGKRTKSKKSSAAKTKIDINSASKDDLDALPGIGPALADKIIQNRPYKSKSDLVNKKVIPQSAYDQIKDEIVAHKTSSTTSSGAAPDETASSGGGSKSSITEKQTSKTSSGTDSDENSKSTSQSAQVPPEKGMVWVNLDTKVYHREGDRWYGKTKHGKYMTEADAIAAGYRAAKR